MIDPEILTVAVGIGLAVSLLFSELFGLAAGGLVVPGYFALFMNQPLVIAVTVGIALATHFVVKLLGSFLILYGKRRTVLVILVAYVIRMAIDNLFSAPLAAMTPDSGVIVIGYIIPGLIALWFDRQGMLETLSTLLAASVVVRMILILVYGTDIRL